MADVKWIKITTDIFDDEKILLIESLPDAYAIIVVWFKLLCLAGKQNNSGVFMMSNQIAYTDKMLATIFRMKETTVQLALKTFQEFGMVEVVEGVITIPNWGKHQTLDKIEAYNQRKKEYMREYRAKQKLISCRDNSSGNSNGNVTDIEEDIDKNKNRLREDKNNILAQSDLENHSMPPVITITLNDKSEYPIYQSDIDKWQELYQSVDIMRELRKMKGWADSNPTKRKTKNGVKRFINAWLSREQDSYHNSPSKKQPKYDVKDMEADDSVDLVKLGKELFGE